VSIETRKDATASLDAFLKWVGKQVVVVGVPADKAARSDGALDNATLGYIHEYGAPEANIPARPWLAPGVEAAEDIIKAEAVRGATRALSRALAGDLGGAKSETQEALNRTGLKVVSKIQGRITAGIAPPLSERTIYARIHRKKRRRAPGAMTPLIDTGAFRRSITYAVRTRD
jgi:hypothetical protein